MSTQGLAAIGLAPAVEGVPPPAAAGEPGTSFADAIAALLGAATAGNQTPHPVPGLQTRPALGPESEIYALMPMPEPEAGPEAGANEAHRPDRTAEVGPDTSIMAWLPAFAPVPAPPTDGYHVVEGAAAGRTSPTLIATLPASVDVPGAPLGGPPAQAASPEGAPALEVTPESPAPAAEVPDKVADIEVVDVEVTASRPAPARAEAAPAATPRRPMESVSEMVLAAEPGNRSEVASALNRQGGYAAERAAASGVAPDLEAVTPAPEEPLDVATPPGVEIDAGDLGETGDSGDPGDGTTARQQAAGVASAASQPSTQPATPGIEPTEAAVIETSEREALVRGVADTVRQATRVGETQIRLVLNPPELGHLDVRIEDGPNGVRVLLTAAAADAGDLLQQHLPALRAALEARDLRVDSIEVQQAEASDLAYADDQAERRQDGSDEDAPQWSSAAATEFADSETSETPATIERAPESGRLDLVA